MGWADLLYRRWRNYWWMTAGAVLALLAFWLRLYRLDAQSFWYDEGISVALAPRSLATITISAAADIHPPLYYYFLHFWTALAGTSEFSARYLSVFEGVLLVVLVLALGRRLASSEVGLLSAFLAATSPLLVYYSQEARMYTQTALFAALSMYTFLKLVFGPKALRGRRRWATYFIASALSIYSHYYGFTILLVENLIILGWLAGRARKESAGRRWNWLLGSGGRWAVGQLALLLCYVPWFAVSLRQLVGWPSISEPFGLDDLIGRLFHVFSMGLSWDAASTPAREAVFACLVVVALFAGARAPRGHWLRALAIVALYLAVPALTMYVASLRKPMYNPKFLLLAVPAYCLWLAIGSSSLREMVQNLTRRLTSSSVSAGVAAVVTIGALGIVTSTTARSLEAYYFDPKYARDDYRALVRQVESHWQPGDAVILNAPGQVEIFDYYYRGDPSTVYPLPQQRPIVESKTMSELERIAESHQRVWLVLWATSESDPKSFVEHWLDEHLFKSGSRWFGSVRLVQYANRGASDGEGLAESSVTFGEAVTLKGYGPLHWHSEPESTVPVTLRWSAIKHIDERYKVFVHLLDAGEYVWGQHDSEPGGGSRPTVDWRPNEVVEDRHGLFIPEGTPPGTYRIEIGLYDATTGRRLEIKDAGGKPLGDRLLFGEVQVEASRAASRGWDASATPNRLSAKFGPLELAGYGLARLGDDAPLVEFKKEDIARLTLFWRASQKPAADYVTELALVAGDGKRVPLSDISPAFQSYATTRWLTGEIVREQCRIRFSDLTPGEYNLTLAVRDASAGGVLTPTGGEPASNGWLVLGQLRVVAGE